MVSWWTYQSECRFACKRHLRCTNGAADSQRCFFEEMHIIFDMTYVRLTVNEQQVFLACRFGLNELKVLFQNPVSTVKSPFCRSWIHTVDIEVFVMKNDLQLDSAFPK